LENSNFLVLKICSGDFFQTLKKLNFPNVETCASCTNLVTVVGFHSVAGEIQ
jgi:hypothetical protein